MAKNAVVASLYIVLTLINPFGWGMIQFRVSEVLVVTPFFDRDYTMGVLLGVGLANFFSPMGIIDSVVGVLVCVITYTFAKFIKNKWINAIIHGTVSGVLVGVELNLILGMPLVLSIVSVAIPTAVVALMGVAFFNKNGQLVGQ